MEDIFISSGIVVLMASLWFGTQTGSWLVTLHREGDVTYIKHMLVAAMILGPLFVFGMLLMIRFTSGNLDGWDLFWLPAATGCVFFISWLGLKVALRIKGRRQ